MRMTQQLMSDALEWAFSAECLLCETRIRPARRQLDMNAPFICYCESCSEQLSPQIPFSCGRCGASLGPYSVSDGGCVHCRTRTLHFRSVVCLGMYEGRLREALLSAKWAYTTTGIRSLTRLLWYKSASLLMAGQYDRVIPVPQYWLHRLLRHFNPAWTVAEELAKQLRVSCDPHIVRRRRRTRPQKRVSLTNRFANQQGAFRLRDAHLVRGRRLLIVDDVLTTGATCSEIAGMLLSAGAAECHVAVIGRVLDHSA